MRKGSHPIDIWLRWLPGKMVTGVIACVSLGTFLYLLMEWPFWIAILAGTLVLGVGAYALFAILDRMG